MFSEGRVHAGLTALHLARLNREKFTERGIWSMWQRNCAKFEGEITLEDFNAIVRMILNGEQPEAMQDGAMFYFALKLEGRLNVVWTESSAFIMTPELEPYPEFVFTHAAVRLGWVPKPSIFTSRYNQDIYAVLCKYVPMDVTDIKSKVKCIYLWDEFGTKHHLFDMAEEQEDESA